MKLTGMWCHHCGGKWGAVSNRKIPLSDYVEGKCDGCGEHVHVVPAFKFKITVAALRAAIKERKANE